MWADLFLPQGNVDVIKGRMVKLQASYNSPGVSDPSGSTVIWNFVSNNTQLVRTKSRLILRPLGSQNANVPELFLSSTLKA